MSRTLASTLVLVGCVGAASAQPLFNAGQAWTDEQIEKWVFGRGDASDGRRLLEWQLAVQMEDIDQACSLSDAQKKKLELAGRGDIKHFFDRYEQNRRKLKVIEHNRQKLLELHRGTNELWVSLNEGLFLEHSLLVKSLPNTLTHEQFALYEAKALKGRALRHHESVLNTVASLKRNFEFAVAAQGRDIVLREEQRQALITLMMRETRPPQSSRRLVQLLLWQFCRLPEEKLKRLFDPDQWEIMKPMVARSQQLLEPMLRREGLLPIEGDEADRTSK